MVVVLPSAVTRLALASQLTQLCLLDVYVVREFGGRDLLNRHSLDLVTDIVFNVLKLQCIHFELRVVRFINILLLLRWHLRRRHVLKLR